MEAKATPSVPLQETKFSQFQIGKFSATPGETFVGNMTLGTREEPKLIKMPPGVCWPVNPVCNSNNWNPEKLLKPESDGSIPRLPTEILSCKKDVMWVLSDPSYIRVPDGLGHWKLRFELGLSTLGVAPEFLAATEKCHADTLEWENAFEDNFPRFLAMQLLKDLKGKHWSKWNEAMVKQLHKDTKRPKTDFANKDTYNDPAIYEAAIAALIKIMPKPSYAWKAKDDDNTDKTYHSIRIIMQEWKDSNVGWKGEIVANGKKYTPYQFICKFRKSFSMQAWVDSIQVWIVAQKSIEVRFKLNNAIISTALFKRQELKPIDDAVPFPVIADDEEDVEENPPKRLKPSDDNDGTPHIQVQPDVED